MKGLLDAEIKNIAVATIATKYVPRSYFEGVFAVFLIALSIFIFFKKAESLGKTVERSANKKFSPIRKPITKILNGMIFEYGYNRILGVTIFFFLVFVVSFLGIGGAP